MTTEICSGWTLSIWPWANAVPTLQSDAGTHAEIDRQGCLSLEFEHGDVSNEQIPRVALQALFDAHDQHIKAYGGFVRKQT